MRSVTTRMFRSHKAALPAHIRRLADEAFVRFQQNPSHPGVQFKSVHPSLPYFSARVGLNHRAIARREDDTLIWFWIGPHDEYDKLIARLK